MAELVPTVVVPLYHWYVGAVPPLVGVAVTVTVVPAQTLLTLDAILTLAVIIGLTVIVTKLDVAGEPDRQEVALEVITTLITSPFAGTYE